MYKYILLFVGYGSQGRHAQKRYRQATQDMMAGKLSKVNVQVHFVICRIWQSRPTCSEKI